MVVDLLNYSIRILAAEEEVEELAMSTLAYVRGVKSIH
jgi:hypothetical protein